MSICDLTRLCMEPFNFVISGDVYEIILIKDVNMCVSLKIKKLKMYCVIFLTKLHVFRNLIEFYDCI